MGVRRGAVKDRGIIDLGCWNLEVRRQKGDICPHKKRKKRFDRKAAALAIWKSANAQVGFVTESSPMEIKRRIHLEMKVCDDTGGRRSVEM